MALTAAVSSMECAASAALTANSGTRAIRGMAARSWNSSTANARRPWRSASSPFSSRTCRAKAVDESDSARPGEQGRLPGEAEGHGHRRQHDAGHRHLRRCPGRRSPSAWPTGVAGRSSRPITNSSMITPNSAKCSTELHVGHQAEHRRADQHAHQQVAEHVADAQQLGERRGDHRGGEEEGDLRQSDVVHSSLGSWIPRTAPCGTA